MAKVIVSIARATALFVLFIAGFIGIFADSESLLIIIATKVAGFAIFYLAYRLYCHWRVVDTYLKMYEEYINEAD